MWCHVTALTHFVETSVMKRRMLTRALIPTFGIVKMKLSSFFWTLTCSKCFRRRKEQRSEHDTFDIALVSDNVSYGSWHCKRSKISSNFSRSHLGVETLTFFRWRQGSFTRGEERPFDESVRVVVEDAQQLIDQSKVARLQSASWSDPMTSPSRLSFGAPSGLSAARRSPPLLFHASQEQVSSPDRRICRARN